MSEKHFSDGKKFVVPPSGGATDGKKFVVPPSGGVTDGKKFVVPPSGGVTDGKKFVVPPSPPLCPFFVSLPRHLKAELPTFQD